MIMEWKTLRYSFVASAVLSLVSSALPTTAFAEAYPTRPVRMVVGFAAGGGTDALARMTAAALTEKLGQQFVVENKTGVNGNLSTAEVANAAPDGYTLLFSNATQIVVSPNTYASMPADPIKGLQHIMAVGEGDFYAAASPASGIKNTADLLAMAKAKPGELKFGTSGRGGNLHLLWELVEINTGIDLTPVHYRGSAPVYPDILAGQIQLSSDAGAGMIPHIKGGTLVGLFKTGKLRSEILPNLPTATEAGIPGLDNYTHWFGLHAPLGTPPDVVAKLRDTIRVAVADKKFTDAMFQAGVAAVDDTPESFTKRVDEDYELLHGIVTKAGIEKQ